MSVIKVLFAGFVLAGLAALAMEVYAAEASAPVKPIKVQDPDIEMQVTITPITDSPFSVEYPRVFRKGEPIPLTVSLENGEAKSYVPIKRGGKSWYDFVDFGVRITDMNDHPIAVKASLLIATLDKKETPKGDFLPPNSGASATWNLMIPESLDIKEDQVKVTVDCRLRASGLGLDVPEGSGNVVHSNSFIYKVKLTPMDTAVVRFRRAVALASDGDANDAKAAVPELEALAAQYPGNLEIALMVATIYEMAGEKAKAIAAYEQWLERKRRELPNLPPGLRSQAEESIAHVSAKLARLKQQGNAGGQ